jgi:hypothetical protein
MKKNLLSFLIIGVSLLFSGIIVVSAATENISFPISELGNCADQSACKVYCDKSENLIACVNFAKTNGMMSQEKAEQALKFADVIQGGGPGGCTDQATCATYCDGSVEHMDECLSFADSHDVISAEQLAEAKKIQKALKNGGQLPGGCADKNTCETYCKDNSHIEECLAFAEKAGFMTEEQLAEAKKVMPFLKNGETPGKCQTKEECDNYCKQDGHFDECIGFAEKAGFVSKEDAEMAKKTGGKGPGNCNSKESCETYCNKSENNESCFAFAKEKGLISEEELAMIEQKMAQLKSGIDQASAEVISCLQDKFGSDVVEKIKNGTFMPNQQGGEAIGTCFAKMAQQGVQKMQEGLGKMTGEMKECLKEKLGAEQYAKMESGDVTDLGPEIQEVMTGCVSQYKNQMQAQIPQEAKDCVDKQYGAGYFDKLMKGEINPPSDLQGKIQSCIVSNNPMVNQLPPEAKDCLESAMGSDVAEKIASGKITQEQIQAQVQNCVMQKMMPSGASQGQSGGMMPSNIPSEYQKYIPSGVPNMPSGYVPSGMPQKPSNIPQGYGPPTDVPMGPPANIPQGQGMGL